MPLKVKAISSMETNNGALVFEEKKTLVTAVCDCGKCLYEITWVEQDVAKDVNALPDAAARILVVARMFPDQKYLFFSGECLREWLKNYVPSKSPRQLAEELELSKKEVEEKINKVATIEAQETSKDNGGDNG